MLRSFHIRNRQDGATLIEVLVSLLLMAVAVIGFAALQVRALATTNTAVYRSQAVGIAQDLTERIRLNIGQIASYRNEANWDAIPTQNCLTNSCSAAEMVNYDIRVTKELAAATLPNGNVAVRPCGGVNTLMCVYVSWNETSTSNAGDDNSCGSTNGSYTSINAACVIMEAY